MNTRLLRRVAKHILAEPKRFVMGSWIQLKEEREHVIEMENVSGKDSWKFPKCGTAACIGGWAHVLSGKEVDGVAAMETGRRLLELRGDQAEQLFAVGAWPDKFRVKFLNGKTPATRAKVAVARIEHFIKTKGKE